MHERYSKQKAQSRVQSTTNGGKALDRAFSFSVVGNQAKNEEVFCHALYFYPDFDNSDCEND